MAKGTVTISIRKYIVEYETETPCFDEDHFMDQALDNFDYNLLASKVDVDDIKVELDEPEFEVETEEEVEESEDDEVEEKS